MRLFFAALAALLLTSCLPIAQPSQPPRVTHSAPAAMQIDLPKGWSFKTDPSGQADWSAPTLDDSGWDVIDAGLFWQQQGYDGYAGTAWYRRTVDVPASWGGHQAYLVIGGVNDEYQVYVDGRQQGQAGSLQAQQSAILHPTSTAVSLTPGRANVLAIKVRSAHNFGGLAKAPVVLTTQQTVPASPEAQAQDLAKAHPEGVWPNWMRGQGRDWTVVGLPQGGPESLEGPDGSWEATAAAPSVSVWVVAGGQLLKPDNATWSLADGHLPAVTNAWQANGIEVSGLLWQEPGSAQWQLHVHNTGPERDLSVEVALRPYQIQPGVSPLYTLAAIGDTVTANGRPALRFGTPPSRIVASTGELGDVSLLAAANKDSRFDAADDGAGLASMALIYDLHLGQGADKTLAFAAPTGSAPPQIVHDDSAMLAGWRDLLRPGAIDLPDKRVTDAYTASLAYILMSNDGGVLHPGPLLHDAFWYRDSTYELSALERAGDLSQVRALLAPLLRFQTPDGEFPANVSAHTQVGHPRGAPEWDSQGEGIHSLVEYERFSHDVDWLKSAWPAIDKAAVWLEQLASTDGSGLLPPGESAEDLGPPDQRHFWDDFWGVIGFRDASYAAGLVGETDRARQLQADADSLLAKTLAAGQPGMAHENGIFPDGPTSQESPADARGTSPAVWPGQLLQPDLAKQLFSGYFDRFVKPYKGAFRHEDNNFWPFGGLEIAHGSLYAGLPDQANYILAWTLDHQTAKGVWAWGDEVSQDASQLKGGDMPHDWVAAEYVDLVRDMLLYERGTTLQLAAGVPAAWLPDGSSGVSVKSLATYFGPVTYQLRRTGSTVTLDLQAGTPPPGGYDLHLPFPIQTATVDGAPVSGPSGQAIHLPPDAKHAVLQVSTG